MSTSKKILRFFGFPLCISLIASLLVTAALTRVARAQAPSAAPAEASPTAASGTNAPTAETAVEEPAHNIVWDLVVLPPSVNEPLAGVQSGLEQLLWEQSRAASLDLMPREELAKLMAERGEGKGPLTFREFPALIDKLQSTAVLVTHFRVDPDDALEIRMLVYEVQSGRIVAGAQAAGNLPDLGLLTAQALANALTRSGLAEIEAPKNGPSLAELASVSRAIEKQMRNEAVGAWREIESLDTPLARSVKVEIQRLVDRSSDANLKAHLLVAQGDSGQAIRMISERRGASEDARDTRFFVLQGETVLGVRQPDFAQAIGFFQKALAIDPKNFDAQLGLARSYQRANQLPEAEQAYTALIAIDPLRPEAYRGLAELKADDPELNAKYLLQAARCERDRLEIEKAKATYAKAEAIAPSLTGVTEQELAALLEQLGEFDGAATSYATAIEAGADTAENWKGIARTQQRLGKTQDAEAALVEAQKKSPDDEEAMRRLGEIYTATNRPKEAREVLQKAYAHNPKDQKVRQAFAYSLHMGGASQQALEVLGSPDDPFASTTPDLAQMAEIYRDLGNLPAARAALQQAIDRDPEIPSLHYQLAVIYDKEGNAVAANEAYAMADLMGARDLEAKRVAARDLPDWKPSIFDSFVSSFQTRNPVIRVAYLGLIEQDARKALMNDCLIPYGSSLHLVDKELERAFGGRYQLVSASIPGYLEGDIADLYRDGNKDEIALRVMTTLQAEAIVLGSLSRSTPGSVEIEVHMFAGTQPTTLERLKNTNLLRVAINSPFRAVNFQSLALYCILIAFLVYKLTRGAGRVIIHLDWAQDTVGMFNVQLSKRPVSVSNAKKPTTTANAITRFAPKLNFLKRFSRAMVDKRVEFKRVPTGTYYVAVQGLLQNSENKEVIGNFVEEKKIEVRRGEMRELSFNFKSEDCPVAVRVTFQEKLAKNAMLALKGESNALRYLAEGETVLYLKPGEYVVVVGFGGRVLEVPLQVASIKPMNFAIEIANDHNLVFDGCASAVEPYLNSDYGYAASLLEKNGLSDVADRIRRTAKMRSGGIERRPAASATTSHVESVEHVSHDAAFYSERAMPDVAFAGAEQDPGSLEDAALAYEASYDFENALNCYQQLGNLPKVMELLEHLGDYFEAGKVAKQLGEVDRAIANFQRIETRDDLYPAACRELADIFLEREQPEIALQTLEGVVRVLGSDYLDVETQDRLARSYEALGRYSDALALCEAIQARDYHFQNISTRIEKLRKDVSSQKTVIGVASAEGKRIANGDTSEESRYEVISELGRGGMGVVYKARDKRLGRIVALKRLPENLREHPKVVELFLREARSAAALNHPNVVTLFDAGEDGGQYFITMEMLEGLPLDEILRKKKKLSAKDVCRIGAQIATGLAYAHKNKIVHRDIKTANLFFTSDKIVKIMDFGLAKMMEEVRRAATVIGGTPYYMAPEQAIGDNVDFRADIYAFGVTLFELVSGEVPFKEGDVTYHHRHTPAPDVREREPSVPAPLAELILQMMAKDREDRPATSAEIADRLTQMASQF